MYVDAFFNRDSDTICVVERKDTKRIYQEYPAKYTFYIKDPKGKYKSVYNDPLTRIFCKNTKEFRKELAINKGKELFESDLNPIFRCLSENYLNCDSPTLNVAYFDIETDFDPERGFAPTDDPFMPITAITVYLQWLDSLITVAIPPKSLTIEAATELVKDFPNTYIFGNEVDMLNAFLDLIDDADVLSGWNSEGYDIPYTVNRVARIMSKNDTRRFCLWNQLPKKREYERYGKTAETYDLVGRIHVDSLELYRKYTYEERHSYSLDAIGEYELGERKTAYEGTLDQLYNNDFKTFIEYNRQDVALLGKLDKKLKFLDLANQLAHDNTVLISTTMGAVAVTEQAIINEAHRRGMQVPDRKQKPEDTQAAGAYVAYPKKGVHQWVGSMDLNSLYPSTIRALNMGPESIIGQLRPSYTESYLHEQVDLKKKSFAGAWEDLFGSFEYEYVMEKRRDKDIVIDWEDGRSDVLSGAEIYQLIFDSNNPWMISANGTLFRTDREAVIPGLLARWYAERKDMQAKLKKAIEAGNKTEVEFWDKRQLVKKINLNSLYGALLNPGCRFFDKRLGQSTTLTGRQIVKHMSSKINEIVTGKYEYKGEAVIYGDTDSEVGSTLHETNFGLLSIEELFNNCLEFWKNGDKEFAYHPDLMVMSYDAAIKEPYLGHIDYIYRHQVTKDLYDIEDELGNIVTVTEDHSVMIERNGQLMEAKPTEILESDILISVKIISQPTLNDRNLKDLFKNLILSDNNDSSKVLAQIKNRLTCKTPSKTVSLHRAPVKAVRKVRTANNEYVYDIGMKNKKNPWFFGNNILLHNSAYFSAYSTLKKDIEAGKIPWTKENVITLYDQIADEVNGTFVEFMGRAFHCPKNRAEVIRAGREVVAETGLFITKKRYAVLVFDKEGKRKDINGKPGEIKAMGLDLRRSDTPVFMQEFLKELLVMVLDLRPEEEILAKIVEFRKIFKQRPGYEKGAPKRVNNIQRYRTLEEKNGKANMPGHVRAAINWNTLKRMNGDRYSQDIVDGMKVIVCKLRDNPLGFTSVAYPVDQLKLPEWFVELPFDDAAMEETIIDNKLDNLIGVLNYDLVSTKSYNTFNNLFDWD